MPSDASSLAVAPAVGRAGQRLGEDDAVLDPQEPLGAGADEALAPAVRDREGIAVGKPLAKAVENAQGVEGLRAPHVLGPGEDDLLELAPGDRRSSARLTALS